MDETELGNIKSLCEHWRVTARGLEEEMKTVVQENENLKFRLESAAKVIKEQAAEIKLLMEITLGEK